MNSIEMTPYPSREDDRERSEANKPGAQIRGLKKLEADPRLTRLERMLGEFDAFAFLGVSRSEETHSNILAWLLNPREKHSMGDFFLAKFLVKTKAATAKQIREADWSGTHVQREWRNVVEGKIGFLDILVLNPDAEFACAIEIKVFSSEHSEQLTRYRKALRSEFGRFHRSHVFVTRDGTLPDRAEEQRFWASVDYRTILRLVKEAIEHGVACGHDEIVAFLQQYTTTLRRRIVPDTDIKRVANRIYLQHRAAIDMICDQKEAHIAELREMCCEVIKLRENWIIIGEREGGKLLGFVDTSWRRFSVVNTGTGPSKTDPSDLLLLDFDFRNDGMVKLILTIMTGEREDVRKLLFERTQGRYPEIFNHRGDQKGGSYKTTHIRLYASEPVLSESDFIDGGRTCWNEKLTAWLSDFAAKEFPKMNRIILESLQKIENEQGSKPASTERK